MRTTTLFTGFPGFLAGRLVPRIVEQDPDTHLIVLVEPRMVERARAVAPAGIEILPGDITDPRLGLDADRYDRLCGTVTRVFHLAAVYDLAVGAALAEHVNVGGTRNVVELCRRCTGLERLHYVSTAYVAGMRAGLVREEELAEGQTFKNFYESTKYAAEVVVRDAMDAVPTTIYRPGIVVGDSTTGETQKFDGPYYLLRAMSGSRWRPILQVGRGDAPVNVVPVDFVVDAIAACARDPQATGHTLHLVDPDPVSSAEMSRLLALEYQGREPWLPLPPKVIEIGLRLAPIRRAFGGTPPESIVYLNHPVRFDTTQAARVLGRNGLQCPTFADYVGPLVGFYRAHEHDPAYRPAHER